MNARRALTVASAIWLACSGLAGGGLGCGSSSDVVAIVEEDAPVSGGVVAFNLPGSQAPMAVPPAAVPVLPPAPQISGASADATPSAGVPAPIDAVVVEAAFRTFPSAMAEPWPFAGTRLRDVFGTPDPDQIVVRVVSEPFEADTYRRLGRPHGLEPGGRPVLVIVDDGFDQFDLRIREGE
jgi:hypothetical protein